MADAKGNKVYRQTATTSDYGVASWSFQLADEVNHGAYKITATLGDTTSEKTVTVKPYVLPKFKVTATTDEDFYRPGQRVTGQVEAAYFFGKPVDGGQVQAQRLGVRRRAAAGARPQRARPTPMATFPSSLTCPATWWAAWRAAWPTMSWRWPSPTARPTPSR